MAPLLPPAPCCYRCHRPLPDAQSGEMVAGVPGLGTFHAACFDAGLSWRERLLHLAHRLLAPKPRGVRAHVEAHVHL